GGEVLGGRGAPHDSADPGELVQRGVELLSRYRQGQGAKCAKALLVAPAWLRVNGASLADLLGEHQSLQPGGDAAHLSRGCTDVLDLQIQARTLGQLGSNTDH